MNGGPECTRYCRNDAHGTAAIGAERLAMPQALACCEVKCLDSMSGLDERDSDAWVRVMVRAKDKVRLNCWPR